MIRASKEVRDDSNPWRRVWREYCRQAILIITEAKENGIFVERNGEFVEIDKSITNANDSRYAALERLSALLAFEATVNLAPTMLLGGKSWTHLAKLFHKSLFSDRTSIIFDGGDYAEMRRIHFFERPSESCSAADPENELIRELKHLSVSHHDSMETVS